MNRAVTAELAIDVQAAAQLAIQLAFAHPEEYSAQETISVTPDGAPVA